MDFMFNVGCEHVQRQAVADSMKLASVCYVQIDNLFAVDMNRW